MEVVIALFVAAMLATLLYFWKLKSQSQALSSIITILGILGTFLGITYGLWNFDTQNIEASIPELLNGLKIAFITSMAGIFIAIVIKIFALYYRKKSMQNQEVAGATIDDLAQLLKAIHETQKKEGSENRTSLNNIEKSLTGEGDTSVVTQLQKLRTQFTDKQDELINAFKDFAKDMAKNNTQALIEALEGVMRDFNTKINEQFGDNFKRLNEAVENILIWQDQYRQQMDELANEFRIAAESVEQSRKSLEIIADQSGTISENAKRLEPVLIGIQNQQEELADHLNAFNMLATNAREAFPIIEGRISELTGGFGVLVKQAIEDSNRSIEQQRTTLDDQNKYLRSAIETANDEMGQTISAAISKTSQQIDRMFRDNDERITQQVKSLDEALEAELTKSMSSLGSQLTSLSKKFVDDYTPLTDRLRDVVQIASRVKRNGE